MPTNANKKPKKKLTKLIFSKTRENTALLNFDEPMCKYVYSFMNL